MNRFINAATTAFSGFNTLRGGLCRRRQRDLGERAVAVVGGSRGLGLQIAREAVRRGARVGICARDAAELERARLDLSGFGARAVAAVCDVRDDASVREAFERLRGDLGPIDVLFNVAGIIGVGPLEALSFDDFRDAVETNFMGPLRATYAVLAEMRARRTGCIVNVTSIGGEIAVPHLLPYCASKFAFVGFSEGLEAELARDGIDVVTVVPGLMRTGSPPRATFIGQPEKEYTLFALADATPLTSVSVERAAFEIVDGVERGASRIVISWQAKVALCVNALAPGLVRTAMTLTSYLLPGGGDRPQRKSGAESETPITRSPLLAASRRASERQNEQFTS